MLDLALSDVDERLRDDLTRHLAGCELCRAEYAAMADAVDHVLGAAGSAAVLQNRGQAAKALVCGPPFLSSDDAAVGSVQASTHDGQPVLIVTVTDGDAGTSYACHLILADGTRKPAGSWTLEDAGAGTLGPSRSPATHRS